MNFENTSINGSYIGFADKILLFNGIVMIFKPNDCWRRLVGPCGFHSSLSGSQLDCGM